MQLIYQIQHWQITLLLKSSHLVLVDNCFSQCYDGASVMSGYNAGVQALIQAQCPQAVYVHCYAHCLNLVLIDVVKRLPVASNFFALMEAVYVFLSSSEAHKIFLSSQQSQGGREIRLRKQSDTRWSCRHESIEAILATFPAVLTILQKIKEGTDRERAIEATGILYGITELKFVVCLVVYKKIFGISARLSDLLQAKSIEIGSAVTVIEAVIETFEKLRSDSKWELFWEEFGII